LYDSIRQCELDLSDFLAKSDCDDVPQATRRALDAVALLREIVVHCETNFQMRSDIVARFGGVLDGDERQVLRLSWNALPAPLPEHRRFLLQQQLSELAQSQ
jgi:hypothetical protein